MKRKEGPVSMREIFACAKNPLLRELNKALERRKEAKKKGPPRQLKFSFMNEPGLY